MGDMITKDEIIDDLNKQIENGLKTQIKLRRETEYLKRQAKTLEYAINGFLKDGLNAIQNHAYKKLNEYFDVKGVMDAEKVFKRKIDGRIFIVYDMDVFNHESNRGEYVLFSDTDVTPQIMAKEKFMEDFELVEDLKKDQSSYAYT